MIKRYMHWDPIRCRNCGQRCGQRSMSSVKGPSCLTLRPVDNKSVHLRRVLDQWLENQPRGTELGLGSNWALRCHNVNIGSTRCTASSPLPQGMVNTNATERFLDRRQASGLYRSGVGPHCHRARCTARMAALSSGEESRADYDRRSSRMTGARPS